MRTISMRRHYWLRLCLDCCRLADCDSHINHSPCHGMNHCTVCESPFEEGPERDTPPEVSARNQRAGCRRVMERGQPYPNSIWQLL